MLKSVFIMYKDELKYNYVIFGAIDDFVVAAFSDLIGIPGIRIMPPSLDCKSHFLNLLYRLHFTPFLNKKRGLPFKGIWNSKLFKNTFTDNKPICFVFYGRYCRYPKSFLEYLSKHYPSCKFVVYHDDIAKSNYGMFDCELKAKIHLFITYDFERSLKDNCLYYPTVYSRIRVEPDDGVVIPQSDVYFLGRGKNRIKYIVSLYKKLSGLGLKCDFNLLDVPIEMQEDIGIHYLKRKMDYTTNIRHIMATKCVVDITQDGSSGFTYRVWEAIAYDKHLISNNEKLTSSIYFDSVFVHFFNNVDSITSDFCDAIANKIINDKKHLISPKRFISFIDEHLSDE